MRCFHSGAVGDSSVLQHVAVYTSNGGQVTTFQQNLVCLQGRPFGPIERSQRQRCYSILMFFYDCKTWVDIIIDIK